MGSAVVLQTEFVLGVVEVRATEEATLLIVEWDLGAWTGQPAHDQNQAQAGFHRRFGRGLSQLDSAAQFGYALGTRTRLTKGTQSGEVNNPFMQCHIKRDHSVCKHPVTAQIDCCAQGGSDRKASESDDFDSGQRCPPDVDPGAIRDVGVRECDLNRIVWW